MKSNRWILWMLFMVAALLGLSCRFLSGSDLSARSSKERETVPGSSGRPVKTAEESFGAATRTLAPPAGSSAMDPTTFTTGYTPAAPQLAPLALTAPDLTQQPEMLVAPTETPTPTETGTPTPTIPIPVGSTVFPTITSPAYQPTQTYTPSPTSGTPGTTATPTLTASPTSGNNPGAAPTATRSPTATTGVPYVPATPFPTNTPYP